MKKNRFINYVLILIFILLAVGFTFIGVVGYQELVQAIEFRVESLIKLILGLFGVIGSLIVLLLLGIKVIGGK